MEIIKFKKLKDNRYQVSIKGSEDIVLFDDTIVKYNLLVNKTLDNKKYEEIINYNNELLGYYKAIKYIGLKMRTKKEITDYLKKNDFPLNTIDLTLKKLVRDGYIDDKKYTKAYIIDQLNLTLNGPDKIKLNLKKLGVEEDYIDDELNKINSSIWNDKINKIIEKKLKISKCSKQIFKRKLEQYLYNNGYYKNQYIDLLANIDFNDKNSFDKEASNIYKKLVQKYSGDKLYFYLKSKLFVKGYDIELINSYIESVKKES